MNSHHCSESPCVAVLRCDGHEFRSLSTATFIYLYLQLVKAGSEPRMFNVAGSEIVVKVENNPSYFLAYKKDQ